MWINFGSRVEPAQLCLLCRISRNANVLFAIAIVTLLQSYGVDGDQIRNQFWLKQRTTKLSSCVGKNDTRGV